MPGQLGEDCISSRDSVVWAAGANSEHYMQSQIVEAIWSRTAREEWGPLESRIAVGSAGVDGRIRRFFFICGLYVEYNTFRRIPLPISNDGVTTMIVRKRFAYALVKSSTKIRLLYGSASGVGRGMQILLVRSEAIRLLTASSIPGNGHDS